MARITANGAKAKHVRSAEMVGVGVGFLAGTAAGLIGRHDHRSRRVSGGGLAGDGRVAFDAPAVAPVVYEFCARVVWSDIPGSAGADLEDAEGIEGFVNAGWELINVIVPFAQTTQLALSYPGNTRKLIAYFRRPIEEEAG